MRTTTKRAIVIAAITAYVGLTVYEGMKDWFWHRADQQTHADAAALSPQPAIGISKFSTRLNSTRSDRSIGLECPDRGMGYCIDHTWLIQVNGNWDGAWLCQGEDCIPLKTVIVR